MIADLLRPDSNPPKLTGVLVICPAPLLVVCVSFGALPRPVSAPPTDRSDRGCTQRRVPLPSWPEGADYWRSFSARLGSCSAWARTETPDCSRIWSEANTDVSWATFTSTRLAWADSMFCCAVVRFDDSEVIWFWVAPTLAA